MTRQYSVLAPTRRWPVAVFYIILNLSLINAWILFKTINNSNISRRNYTIKLIEEIAQHSTKYSTQSPITPQNKRKVLAEKPQTPNKKQTSDSPRQSCQIIVQKL